MSGLVIYTLGNCPTCARAKADLDAAGVPYEERRVDQSVEYWEQATELAITVPILVREDGRLEVGWKGETG